MTDLGTSEDPQVQTAGAADESLPACFERIAAAHRWRQALVSDTWSPTYEELNVIANRLAHAIIAQGVVPGDRVAMLMEHDAPAVAALCAIAKVSGIVVALNPTHPHDHLRQLVEDSEPSVLLADRANREVAAELARPGCALLTFEEGVGSGPEHNPLIKVSPAATAVLGYTSGSTGRPKAVMMAHRQFRRNVAIHTEAMRYTSEDRLPLFGALSGGQGITNVWCGLLNGAALCPFPIVVRGVTGLADWIERRRLSVYMSSASIFRNFVATLPSDTMFHRIRAVRLSSEPATSDDFRMFQRHFPDHCVFVHTLSCSETCNVAWSRRSKWDPVPEGRLPIGLVSRDQEVLLLDDDLMPVRCGEVGEIVVRSRYVANGYWRDPDLTASRFSEPLDDRGTRQVRTGDLGRLNADGHLEFIGRRDRRIKIRGSRIEPSEVENALRRISGIQDAAVEAIERSGLEPSLVAFVSAARREGISPASLRRALRRMLPAATVPSAFVVVDRLPLTSTGKLDRETLRESYRPEARRGEPTQTATESMLAGFWADALQLERVGRHDDFFSLGGDSLVAAVVAARVYDAFKAELTLADFAEHPTLAALAARADEIHERPPPDDDVPLVRLPRDGPLPLSFAQERAWQGSTTPHGMAGYVWTNSYRVLGPLDRELLGECMSELNRRHEILRTTFAEVDGQPVQIVHPPEPAALRFTDLSGAAIPEQAAAAIVERERARTFDLGRLPLMAFSLIRLREDEHWLVRTTHHIVVDAWTSRQYFQELALLYTAKARNEPVALPDAPALQCADYAAWRRATVRPERAAFRADVAWWKAQFAGNPPSTEPPLHRLSYRLLRRLRLESWPLLQPSRDPTEGILTWGLDRDVSERLDRIAGDEGVTFFVVRLAALVALMASETGRRDVVIGTYVTHRERAALQNLMGYFVNLVALRFVFEPQVSFRQWLVTARRVVMSAEAHSAIPFDMLSEALARAGAERAGPKIIFHVSQNPRVLRFADVTMTLMQQKPSTMPWGFSFNIDETMEHDNCKVTFNANVYDPLRVCALVERYKMLLDAVSREPDRPLAELLR